MGLFWHLIHFKISKKLGQRDLKLSEWFSLSKCLKGPAYDKRSSLTYILHFTGLGYVCALC